MTKFSRFGRVKLSNEELASIGEMLNEKGIAQKDIAETLNLAQATISNYFQGKVDTGIPSNVLFQIYQMMGEPKGLEFMISGEELIRQESEIEGKWKGLFETYKSRVDLVYSTLKENERGLFLGELANLVNKYLKD